MINQLRRQYADKRMKKTKSMELEYPDAPSGVVLMYNYKEPFIEFRDPHNVTKGYGFTGALAEDSETGHIQCHFCGEWFNYLPKHLHKEHNMTAKEYKKHVGLRNTSVLISEKTREKLVLCGINSVVKKANLLKKKKGDPISEETRAKISETLKKHPRESENETGTCPAQLIKRYQDLCNERGEVVSIKKLYWHESAERVFGSWSNFLKCAGYEAPKEITGKAKLVYSQMSIDEVKEVFLQYKIVMGKYPRLKDIPNILCIKKGSSSTARKNMVANIKKIIGPLGSKLLYTKVKEIGFGKILDSLSGERVDLKPIKMEEIKSIYQNFKRIHGRAPSLSDSKRGMFVNTGKIYYYFTNWKECINYCSN